MQITTATYRRKVNTGNDESFDFEMTCTLEQGDTPGDVAAYLGEVVADCCREEFRRMKMGGRGGRTVLGTDDGR